MKHKPKQIIKGILLSAIASFFNTNVSAEESAAPIAGGKDENSVNELESSSNRIH